VVISSFIIGRSGFLTAAPRFSAQKRRKPESQKARSVLLGMSAHHLSFLVSNWGGIGVARDRGLGGEPVRWELEFAPIAVITTRVFRPKMGELKKLKKLKTNSQGGSALGDPFLSPCHPPLPPARSCSTTSSGV